MFLAIFLLLGYFVLLLFYSWAWKTMPIYVPPNTHVLPKQQVALIIPARNEAAHIEQCLNGVARQDFPAEQLQIIVVDDHSTDSTVAIVRQWAILQPHLSVLLLSLADFVSPDEALNSYKKKAISLAIAHTTADVIVTTDADCVPLSSQWLAKILHFINEKKAVFVTSGVMVAPTNNFFSIFQALDLAGMMITTGTSVRYRLGDMCNGGNLAYLRWAFEEVGGFSGIDHLASGDDMLLMGKMRHHFPTQIHFLKSYDTLVSTPAPERWRDFVQQRIRWASKTSSYSEALLPFILLWVWCSNVVLLVDSFWAFYTGTRYHLGIMAFCWTLKTLADVVYLNTACRFLNKTVWLRYFLPAQLLHVWYIASVGILANFKRYEWKGRRVQ